MFCLLKTLNDIRDMIQRKKEMEKKVQEEFAKARKEAENYYATI